MGIYQRKGLSALLKSCKAHNNRTISCFCRLNHETLSKRFKQTCILSELLKEGNNKEVVSNGLTSKVSTDDDAAMATVATEIVVVSDTVRQRRARTPGPGDAPTVQSMPEQQQDTGAKITLVRRSRDTFGEEEEERQEQVGGEQSKLLDVLPAQTFCLAETSALFSQISKVPLTSSPPTPPPSPTTTTATTTSDEIRQFVPQQKAQMVEIRAKNIPSDKMSVRNIELEPQTGERVDTVNVSESAKPFKSEHVETVQILDLSEDSDSSMRIDTDGSAVSFKHSKQSLTETPTLTGGPNAEDDVELRLPGPAHTSTPFLRVEKQRISFEEKRKRMENERDILRDSEEEGEDKTFCDIMQQPKAKRWRQLQHNMLEQLQQDSGAGTPERDSFYNTDKDTSFDAEPLVFSDDEEIPRFSLEMTPTFDSDSDMSRIETPAAKKPNNFPNKILPNTLSSLDNSNITLKSPHIETLLCFPNTQSLDQRVQDFEKAAKYMIRKLEATKEKISCCDEGEDAVEDLKMLIAPDAATLISQGDSLVLETHGKQGNVSRLVMRTQILLREKFREVQQTKSVVPISQQNNSPSPRSTLEKTSIKDINLEELALKGIKRINDLIDKSFDRTSDEELERRLTEINVSYNYFINYLLHKFPTVKS